MLHGVEWSVIKKFGNCTLQRQRRCVCVCLLGGVRNSTALPKQTMITCLACSLSPHDLRYTYTTILDPRLKLTLNHELDDKLYHQQQYQERHQSYKENNYYHKSCLVCFFGVLEVRGRLGGEVQCCAVLRARSGKVATGVFKEVISWLGW